MAPSIPLPCFRVISIAVEVVDGGGRLGGVAVPSMAGKCGPSGACSEGRDVKNKSDVCGGGLTSPSSAVLDLSISNGGLAAGLVRLGGEAICQPLFFCLGGGAPLAQNSKSFFFVVWAG